MDTLLGFQLTEQVIQLSGDDRKSYLHGQVTQDINKLTPHTMLWAGHCNAKGKLWAVYKLLANTSSYFAVVSQAELEKSLAELKKYAVFSKVSIEHRDDLQVVGLSYQNEADLAPLGIVFPEQDTSVEFANGIAFKLDNNRVQLLVEKSKLAELSGIAWQDDNSAWLTQNILGALPVLNQEHIDELVPQMVNLQAIGGISFTKGCYTGQETVARMKYLGKNKRAMFALVGNATASTEFTDLEMQMGDNWRRAGKVLAYTISNQQVHCLAVLPNDVTPENVFRIKDDEASQLSLLPLPYSLLD